MASWLLSTSSLTPAAAALTLADIASIPFEMLYAGSTIFYSLHRERDTLQTALNEANVSFMHAQRMIEELRAENERLNLAGVGVGATGQKLLTGYTRLVYICHLFYMLLHLSYTAVIALVTQTSTDLRQ
jgi:hypothetical protein